MSDREISFVIFLPLWVSFSILCAEEDDDYNDKDDSVMILLLLLVLFQGWNDYIYHESWGGIKKEGKKDKLYLLV